MIDTSSDNKLKWLRYSTAYPTGRELRCRGKGVRRCTHDWLLGVGVRASWVYTCEALRCRGKRRLGVHLKGT